MQAIAAVTLPFFALVLCGYLGARQQLLPESAVPGLNAYVLYFALPCLLFRFGSSVPLGRLLDPALLGVYVVCALTVVGLTLAVTGGSRGVGRRDAAFGALVAAFPNSGFMGVPLLVALLGDQAAGPVIGTILVDFFLTSTLCLAIASAAGPRRPYEASAAPDEEPISGIEIGDSSQGSSPAAIAATVGRSLRGALTNPLPWSIAFGAVAGASKLVLPGWIASIVRLLADSATPVALFTIGAVLWRAGRHAQTRTPLGRYLPVALIKLIVHPGLVLGLGGLARWLGAPIDGFGLTALVLTAALPSASNVSLLAERYGADNGRVARIIMASTVLAFLSFTVLAWALPKWLQAAPS